MYETICDAVFVAEYESNVTDASCVADCEMVRDELSVSVTDLASCETESEKVVERVYEGDLLDRVFVIVEVELKVTVSVGDAVLISWDFEYDME